MDRVYRFLPPGFGLGRELKKAALALGAAAAVMLIGFAAAYLIARGAMYTYDSQGRRVEIEGAAFAPFGGMILPGELAFAAASVAFAAMCFYYLAYHYTGGSRGIYTMRRVRRATELLERCCALPVMGVIACQLIWRTEALLCGLIYAFATPEHWLAAGAWESVLYAVTH